MKDFFKFTFATVTGIILSCVVLFFGGMLILFSALASSEAETQVSSNSVMMLELKGELRERYEAMPYETLFSDDYQIYGLDDILSSIRKAKENENIKGIYLQLSYLTAGYAAIEEIRNTLLDFKESGKFVIAYADNYQQSLYYLASVADKVLMNPKGSLEWRGIASTPVFYKDLLEKIGVEMQIFKVGTYKSAVEPFIATEMSPANREQVTAYIHSVWDAVTQAVSESRNISIDKLNRYADNMIMFEPSEEAVKCGLVDTLIYKNNVRDYLKPLVGLDKDDNLPVLELQDMVNVHKNQPKDKSGNIVAVYYASGEIVDYGSTFTLLSDQPTIITSKVIRDLRRLQENDDVKAVVLRINSPGGSAYGSEQLWYAISQLKKEKPVIVSMGEYAASGGLTDKIGLDFDVVKTNEYADFGATGRPMNEGEKALMQKMVNQGYDLFLTRCSEGRGIAREELDKIAQGRVWTGSTAKELGLVDELGGLDRALEIACRKAGIDAYTVVSYPAKQTFLEMLMSTNLGSYLKSRFLSGKAGELYRQFSILENFDKRDRIQARLPFELNIE